jgi:hypothetical protein
MNEPPEVPTPPPDIPRGLLWTSLMAPPLMTSILTMVIGATYKRTSYGEAFLLVLPVALLTILFCLASFVSAWKVRYRGRSLVLTSFGYLLGQIILCLGLWFGGCYLIMSR